MANNQYVEWLSGSIRSSYDSCYSALRCWRPPQSVQHAGSGENYIGFKWTTSRIKHGAGHASSWSVHIVKYWKPKLATCHLIMQTTSTVSLLWKNSRGWTSGLVEHLLSSAMIMFWRPIIEFKKSVSLVFPHWWLLHFKFSLLTTWAHEKEPIPMSSSGEQLSHLKCHSQPRVV